MRRALLLVLVVGCGRLSYDLRLPAEAIVLGNGARVVVLADDTTDLVAVVARYSVGARTDPPGRYGLAHLAEHTTFEYGAPGGDSLRGALRARTLLANGFTKTDATEFVALAHPDQLGRVLELEARRMRGGCEEVAAAAFERERAVVVEEVRERRERGRGAALAIASLFPPGHPWSHTVADEEAAVPRIDKAEVCRFLAAQYVPGRLTVVIAGRVDAAHARDLAEFVFGPIPARAAGPLADPVVSAVPVAAERTLVLPGAGAAVHVAWPIPPGQPAEVTAFLVAAMSDQNRRIRALSRFALGYEVDVVGEAPGTYLVVSVGLVNEEQVGPTIEAVRHAGAEPLRVGLPFEWLRYSLLVGLYLRWENLVPRAQSAAAATVHRGDATLRAYLRAIRDVDPDAVREAKVRVLDPARALVRVVVPGEAAPVAARSVASPPPPPDVRPAPEPEPDATVSSVRNRFAGVRTFTLSNGLRVMLLPRRSLLPVVSARLVFFAGSAHAPPDQPGVAEATAAVVEPAARTYPVGKLTLIEEPLVIAGARRASWVTPDTTVLAADALDESLAQLLEGLEGWATAEIRPSREVVESVFALFLRRLTALFDLGLRRAVETSVYGASHPYAGGGLTDLDSIRKLRIASLRNWQRTHYCAGNAALVVVGAFETGAAEGLIDRLFGSWPPCGRTPLVVAAAARREAPAVIVVPSDQPTVEVVVAYPTGPRDDGKAAARYLLSELLAARLRAVRERLGASYGVTVSYEPRVGPGMHLVVGRLDPARAAPAMAEIRRAVSRWRPEATGVGFAAAKRAVVARLLGDIDDAGALAGALIDLALDGRRPRDWPSLVDEVARLAPEDVAALGEAELAPGRATVLLRGPRDAIAKLGW